MRFVDSKDVTPDEASKDLDELKKKDLEDTTGGMTKPYPDTWSG